MSKHNSDPQRFLEYLLDGQVDYKIKPKFLNITKGLHLTPSKTSFFMNAILLSYYFSYFFKNIRLLHVSIILLIY